MVQKGNFVFIKDHGSIKNRVAVVVKTDHDGGVFRGHCDVWLGNLNSENQPVTFSVLESKCTVLETPISED